MSLKAILRSVISENDNGDIIEQYVVDLYDRSLPFPYLGGVAELRAVNVSCMTDEFRIHESAWEYEGWEAFGVSASSEHLEYGKQLRRLDAIAIRKHDAKKPGETFQEMRPHFEVTQVPFQVEGVEYDIRTPKTSQTFSRDLDRKFGTLKADAIKSALNQVMGQNEMAARFTYSNPKPQPSVKSNYKAWATFS